MLTPAQLAAIPKYRLVTVTLAAGEERAVPYGTDALTLITATNKLAVQVKFNSEGEASDLIEGLTLQALAAERFWLKNTDVVANTIQVATGSARILDNRALIGAVATDVNLTKLAGASSIGQKTSANSLSVVLASDLGAVTTTPHALAASRWAYAAPAAGLLNTVVPVAIVAAVAAKKHYLTGLQISTEALTNATEVVIQEAGAGAVLFRYKVPAATAQPLVGLTFPAPIPAPTANVGLEVATLTASGAGAVYVNVQGFSA